MPLSKSEANRPIVVTPGDPAGIGPDISISVVASGLHSSDCIFVCDPSVLADRAKTLSTECTIHVMASITDRLRGALNVWPVTCEHRIRPGVITAHSAPYVLECLETAFNLCSTGEASAWVTGPVNKAAFNEAGITFSGHTEWIAARAGIPRVVMMLAAGSFRVALVTTHLPLHAVPAAITDESFETTLRITDQSLRSLFKSESPRLGICGLNPHAGESGYLGREEIEVLGPVIEKLRKEGMNLSDPLPADTLLTPQRIADFDAIIAMYHDQGLPTLKYAGFGEAVNITLGLPFVRTSVDHGTAADLAGTGRASDQSLSKAIQMAAKLSQPISPLT